MRRNKIRVLLEAALFALLFVLMFANDTGIVVHEIAAVAAIGLSGWHIWSNRKWLARTLRTAFSNETSRRPGSVKKQVVGILLVLLMTLTVVSGLLISETICPPLSAFAQGIGIYQPIRSIHEPIAILMFIALLFHGGMHAKNMVKLLKTKPRTAVSPAPAICVA